MRNTQLSFIILLIFFCLSCESKEDIKQSIDELKNQKELLGKENNNLISVQYALKEDISSLKDKLTELNILKQTGVEPKYLLELHFSPSTLRLSNSMRNSFSITIPVDKRLFYQVNVGDDYGRMSIKSKNISK